MCVAVCVALLQYKLDGADFTVLPSAATSANVQLRLSGLTLGPHVARVEVYDATGHKSSPLDVTWKVSVAVPSAQFVTTPAPMSGTAQAHFQFVAVDSSSTVVEGAGAWTHIHTYVS
jgi:hypothetical protein